ncbi:hypothetical protein [Alterisphingorhabdus coralli]|uniref:Uncharacterized protein n=1 Tax=Alterisphingorhabdus coralli TaxID=3071408 RepID=A0AA97F6Z3_9SPHN|nr:hypothetical protein [Parasphingorhabdus sp. SCSIO 66989]WOE75554.1 hypothetical protein RB602_02235 [Parasphingorhabdus sp. SCSIO 66989]
MSVYEIMFEGIFAQDWLRPNGRFAGIEGFYALRQIAAKSVGEAVEKGAEAIRMELASEDNALAANLERLIPSESRMLDNFDRPPASGFTFF